jgi:hypothetical protein
MRQRFTEVEVPKALRSLWRRGSLESRCSRPFGAFGGRVLGDEVFGALRGSWHRGFRELALEALRGPER